MFQASTLCLFNAGDNSTLGEIVEKTQMSKEALKKNLTPLCHPKRKGQTGAVLKMAKPKFDDMTLAVTVNLKLAC